MSINDHALGVGAHGQGPDRLDPADMVALVGDVLRFQRWLAPFVEHAAQVGDGQAGVRDHLVGTALIERTQCIGFLADCHFILQWWCSCLSSPPSDTLRALYQSWTDQ